jgi:large subunit ribosomal protein L21
MGGVEIMYAIIETGGKQYRVQEGDAINVEKIAAAEGETLEIAKVLLVEKDGNVTVGTPYVAGASVAAKVVEHGKADKVIAFRYKPKKHVRVKKGHRQPYTKLVIETIKA